MESETRTDLSGYLPQVIIEYVRRVRERSSQTNEK